MENNFFEKVNDAIRNTESSIVNMISAIAPWLAPIAPAYMTYKHAIDTLKFEKWVAIPSAIVVEILGFSTVSTFLAFWFHNRKNTAESKRAPVEVVAISFIFYLTLILVSNVILDWFDSAKFAVIIVRALFTLQSVPAALIVAVRTQHRDLLANIEKEKIKNKNSSRTVRTNENQTANGSRTFASLNNAEKYSLNSMDTVEASQKLNVTPRAIQKWKKKIEEEIAQGRL